jgi:Asp-tRNA(Asn)/Glu-tRNA(Gln) amidotransferase A subunit family amidase
LHSVLAVPSRLYTPPSTEKPLNGVRVTVKDIFHVRGIVTTLGSRAYSDCYGPQEYTSDYLKHLIDLGVVLVGKTKMSAFAGSEIPPEKCIDYFPPWNPRADGYQGPSGSSSGAGSTIAGYDWLDVSLASDSKLM